MSQTDRLLELLREAGGRGVTPLDALDAIGSFRLAARVYDLRRAGYDVRRQLVRPWPSRKTVAMYVLHEEPVQMEAFG